MLMREWIPRLACIENCGGLQSEKSSSICNQLQLGGSKLPNAAEPATLSPDRGFGMSEETSRQNFRHRKMRESNAGQPLARSPYEDHADFSDSLGRSR